MKKVFKYIGIFCLIAVIMVGGAAAFYTLKHGTFFEDISQLFESQVRSAASSGVGAVVDMVEAQIPTKTATATTPANTTQYAVLDAGGMTDGTTSSMAEATSSEPAVTSSAVATTTSAKSTTTVKATTTTKPTTTEKMTTTRAPETTTVKERETPPAPTTTVKERETTPAPTTTAKKKGVVVTDERTRAALIQLGYDPDNYVASDLSFDEKVELTQLIFGKPTSPPAENVRESIRDYSQSSLSFDGSNLPKPMG